MRHSIKSNRSILMLSPEFKPLIQLSIPLIAVSLIESTYGYFNVLLLAQLGPDCLASGGLASSLFHSIILVFFGIVSNSGNIMAFEHGSCRIDDLKSTLFHTFILCLLIGIPTVWILQHIAPVLAWAGQSPQTISEAQSYLSSLSYGIVPDLFLYALFLLYTAIGKPKVGFFSSLIYLPLALLLNAALMFGHAGLPRLGMVGIGFGSSISITLACVILWAYTFFTRHRIYLKRFKIKYMKIILLIRTGIPVGLMYGVEIGYFTALSFCMGKISIENLAAEQIVMQVFWLTASVIFGIGQGASIRAGYLLGQKKYIDIQYLTRSAIYIAIFYGTFIVLLYHYAQDFFIALDLSQDHPHAADAYITQQTKLFFPFMAAFQVLDGIRHIMLGILRGLQSTRFGLMVSVVSLWMLALPIGYGFGFSSSSPDPLAFWWSLIGSMILANLMIYYQYRIVIRNVIHEPQHPAS